jgi:RNA polymerase sigma-32 factor
MASRLTAVQEATHIKAWQEHGRERARDIVVASQQAYVQSIANNLAQYGASPEDLVQEGNVGLMLALDKFDISKGVRFITYAVYWVRACMLYHVASMQSPLGVPNGSHTQAIYFALSRARARSEATAVQDIAAHFHVPVDKVQALLGLLTQFGIEASSVDSDYYEEGERVAFPPGTVLEHLAEHNTPAVCASQNEQTTQVNEGVRAALSELDSREQIVARMRWMQDPPSTLDAVGKCIGLSREGARLLEGRVKVKLAKRLEALREGLEQ